MESEGKWDLVEMMVMVGGLLGVLFAFLRVTNVLQRWATLIVADWTVTGIEMAIFALIFLVGILNTDIETYFGLTLLIVVGLLATILLANIAGIVLVIAAVIIIGRGEFTSELK